MATACQWRDNGQCVVHKGDVVSSNGKSTYQCSVFKQCQTNVAFNMLATQSSTPNKDFGAMNAVDGDLTTCMLTSTSDPWLKINLQGSLTITEVVLYHNVIKIGASNTPSNYIVTVGNDANGGNNARCHTKHSGIKGKYRIVFECGSLKGQGVHIRLNGPEQLALCEVEVHTPKTFDNSDIEGMTRHALASVDTNILARYDSAKKSCIMDGKCSKEYGHLRLNMGRAASGLQAGMFFTNAIGNILKKDKMSKALQSVTKAMGSLGPALGGFAAILTMTGLFGPSEEVQRLNQLISMVNEGFKNMNGRFDELDKKFEDLANLIGKSTFYTKLNSHSLELIVVKTKVALYFEENDQVKKAVSRKDMTEALWTRGYDAMIKLKAYFESELGHSQSICKMVRDFTDQYRLQTLQISLQIFNRMVQGARDLVLIKGILEGPDDADFVKERMVKWLKQVGKKIDDSNEDIRESKWIGQWKLDVTTLLANYKGANSALASALKTYLASKYDWRDWFVITHTYRGGNHKQYHNSPCDGGMYTYFVDNSKGLSVYVSSVKSTSSYKNVNTRMPSNPVNDNYHSSSINNAKWVYDQYLRNKSCTPGFIAGIAEKGGSFAVEAPERRKNVKSVKTSQKKWSISHNWYENMHFHAFVIA